MRATTGNCLVAFLDLLGFSARMRETWNTPDDVLQKLLSIKGRLRKIPRVVVTGREDSAASLCDVMTFSDSIIVESGASPATEMAFFEEFLSVAATASFAVHFAALEGFGIRGALELGPLYRSNSETIGPAFLDVYALEQKARSARVVIGPKLAATLAEYWGGQLSADGVIYTCHDGLIAVQPLPKSAIPLTAVRDEAGSQAWRYEELLRVAPRYWNKAIRRPRSPRDFISASRAAEKLLGT